MDFFTAYLIGGAVKELREETKKDVMTLLEEGETSTKFLVEVLPHLRSLDTKRLRTRILAHLDNSKVAAVVRKHTT